MVLVKMNAYHYKHRRYFQNDWYKNNSNIILKSTDQTGNFKTKENLKIDWILMSEKLYGKSSKSTKFMVQKKFLLKKLSGL